MKNYTKKTLMTGLALTGMFLAACQSPEETNVEEQKELIIGLDDTFAPMGFRNDEGELIGFDIDLANAVAEDLDYEISFQPIDWAMKETELNAGNIDMIWNGYTITDERAEKVDFGIPYLNNSQLIVTLEENGINEKSDLEGKVVAAQQSSSAVEAIESDASNISEKFQNGEIVQYPSNNDVFNDLISGRSDAIVVDETLGRFYMNQNPDAAYKVLDEDFGKEEYAIGFRPDDDTLREEINASIENLMENGTYDSIYAEWFTE
ncbi:amino acid ABC transporter substrate-binding protein [Lacticigenium naphthae]|uniref:amino acid ABC transporter substrate-binding protein n=1 Tax=Lacticigenium naphthae TaxID=515351 RepID=UPI000424C365|nr:amino acid ABC transporter substrate-binding protein [Lacticigenium naphthae]